MVKLADALKASKTRKAVAVVRNDGGTAYLTADDAGVTIVGRAGYITRTWVDLLPRERDLMLEAPWEPQDPLSPLQQLADTLTDWSDDD